jgi:heme/copper-type cytochrome/quinol oxidase subunit 1
MFVVNYSLGGSLLVNHKVIGVMYVVLGMLFGCYGSNLSICLRIAICSSGSYFISCFNENLYNLIVSIHGIVMIFFLVMPVLFGGFGN